MPINIIFHENYFNARYTSDPAAAEGRLDGIMEIVRNDPESYQVMSPVPALEADILRAHGRQHYEQVKQQPLLYDMAALAAGGAVMAAETAHAGEPAFAVVRPPGHHASAGTSWGFCYFNNLAVSLLKLFAEKKIRNAFILDFDLHTGDGNINILENRKDGFRVTILNPESTERGAYVREVESCMARLSGIDIFAASAGFDQGIDDWGELLYPEDYTELGRLMKDYANKVCNGRRYAVLEGGYNHRAIGSNMDAFCRGFA